MASQEREKLWMERIAQWRDCGLSQQAFAQQHGYPIRQVGYWVQRLGRSEPTAAAKAPVVIKLAVAEPEIPAGASAGWLADLLRGL